MTTQFDLNNINSFLNQATQTIMCNSDCQKQKQSEQLKRDFLNAQVNLASAPNQLEIAEKNYVIFEEGELAYNELRDNQLEKNADLIIQKYKEKFQDDVEKINLQLNSYTGLVINFKNIVELYIYYKNENRKLFKQLKEDTNDILTNERKTYYEDQEIDKLKYYYYYIFLTIYYISVICFTIFSFIYPSNINWKIQILISIFLFILPFISTWVLGMLIYILYEIYNLLPKNVYK
jgi:hypothetical protein